MTCAEILPRLYNIIRTLVENPPELSSETDLLNDIGLDSLAVMHLLEQVEDDFDVLVPLNVIAEVRTLNDFALQLQQIIDGAN